MNIICQLLRWTSVHPPPLRWASPFNSIYAVCQQETTSFLPPAAHTDPVQCFHGRKKRRKENIQTAEGNHVYGYHKAETKATCLLPVVHPILSPTSHCLCLQKDLSIQFSEGTAIHFSSQFSSQKLKQIRRFRKAVKVKNCLSLWLHLVTSGQAVLSPFIPPSAE